MVYDKGYEWRRARHTRSIGLGSNRSEQYDADLVSPVQSAVSEAGRER